MGEPSQSTQMRSDFVKGRGTISLPADDEDSFTSTIKDVLVSIAFMGRFVSYPRIDTVFRNVGPILGLEGSDVVGIKIGQATVGRCLYEFFFTRNYKIVWIQSRWLVRDGNNDRWDGFYGYKGEHGMTVPAPCPEFDEDLHSIFYLLTHDDDVSLQADPVARVLKGIEDSLSKLENDYEKRLRDVRKPLELVKKMHGRNQMIASTS